jgi:general secretion pathway protein H
MARKAAIFKPATDQPAPDYSRGITLVELLVVISIASVALAVVMPSFRAGMAGVQLRTSARKLAAVIGYARQTAIHNQRQYTLELVPRERKIIASEAQGPGHRSLQLPEEIDMRVENADADASPAQQKEDFRYVIYPDGAMPGFRVRLATARRELFIETDPLTGMPQVIEK